MTASDYRYVSEIPDSYTLIVNSQDRGATLESVSTPYEVEECMEEYGCLFALVGDGEIIDLYGCCHSTPYLGSLVYRIAYPHPSLSR